MIREACITLAYMSKTLTSKLDQFLVYTLNELISLIQNSAKVISSSGTIALKYVMKFSPSAKLVPIITQNLLQSKSKDIRASLSEVMVTMFEDWPTKMLEKNAQTLRDVVRKGLQDADVDARRHSRKAFWLYRKHFPQIADQLYQQLDSVTQKGVDKERDGEDDVLSHENGSMTASLRGSSSSLNSMPGSVISELLGVILK